MQNYSKTILDDLKMKLDIINNKYNLNIDKLLQLGARNNPKRSFLFINNYLGKHIPIKPLYPLAMGSLLGLELLGEENNNLIRNKLINYLNDEKDLSITDIDNISLDIDKKTLFIGFAETATGLGHSVFSCFKNSYFVHTTREEIFELKSSFNFEEEHSHATSHLCYLLDKNIIKDIERIVLIDDEMSTGKTNLNLIKSLYKETSIKDFVCMSILDWRSEENINKYSELEEELQISIKVHSLINGNFECNNSPITSKEEKIELKENKNVFLYYINLKSNLESLHVCRDFTLKKTIEKRTFYLGTGKFGLSTMENKICFKYLESVFNRINLNKFNEDTLFIGFGEFMYIPMYIAAKYTPKVDFYSPSLSPIHSSDNKDYPINSVDILPCPYNIQSTYHMYNLKNKQYKELIVFLEREPTNEFLDQLSLVCQNRGIKNFTIISCN